MEKVFVDVCCTSRVWYNLYTRFIFKFAQETDNIHCETMELNALELKQSEKQADFKSTLILALKSQHWKPECFMSVVYSRTMTILAVKYKSNSQLIHSNQQATWCCFWFDHAKEGGQFPVPNLYLCVCLERLQETKHQSSYQPVLNVETYVLCHRNLRSGESLMLCGPSGVGKSSLLRSIAGLWHRGGKRRFNGCHVRSKNVEIYQMKIKKCLLISEDM